MLCIACLPLLALADGRVHDEAIIFDLLENGNLVLTEDVAAVLPVEESSRQIRRVGLEKDGIRVRAAFRDDSQRIDTRGRGAGKHYDAYYNEVAAFVISRYLGLKLIPPTVLRSLPISSRGLEPGDPPLQGSLQLWIENAIVVYDLEKQGLAIPGDPVAWQQQLKELKFFDCIIGNLDRHQGNLLADSHALREGDQQSPAEPMTAKLWAIDHTKAFHSAAGITGEHCRISKIKTRPVSLTFIQHLRTWQPAEVEKALRNSGLSDEQIERLNLRAAHRRAHKILSHLDKMQRSSQLTDEMFYSSGAWHRVW